MLFYKENYVCIEFLPASTMGTHYIRIGQIYRQASGKQAEGSEACFEFRGLVIAGVEFLFMT